MLIEKEGNVFFAFCSQRSRNEQSRPAAVFPMCLRFPFLSAILDPNRKRRTVRWGIANRAGVAL